MKELKKPTSPIKKNLKYTVYFATGITNNSSTAIENIIVDNSELDMSCISHNKWPITPQCSNSHI